MLRAPADVVVPPLPIRISVVFGLDALEVKLTLPVSGPIAAGLKETVNVLLLPGAMEIGN